MEIISQGTARGWKHDWVADGEKEFDLNRKY
jgi:hypothetical protein